MGDQAILAQASLARGSNGKAYRKAIAILQPRALLAQQWFELR